MPARLSRALRAAVVATAAWAHAGSAEEPIALPTMPTSPPSAAAGSTEAPVQPLSCALLFDVDYQGNDLQGHSALDTGTSGGCASLCLATPACTHFTFATAFNGCYLKTSGAGAIQVDPSFNAVSGQCRDPPTPSPTTSFAPTSQPPPIAVTGELKLWHKVTIDVQGPLASESGVTNPFTDYRYVVHATHISGRTLAIPGYFAADGNAAETGGTSGRVFRAHLAPPLVGSWTATVSFTTGVDVAINGGGTPVVGVHNLSVAFVIAPSDKTSPDFRAKGMLLPTAGERYLVFNGTGERFLKAGADSPENLLAYYEFDNTVDAGNAGPSTSDGLHHYDAHLADWKPGDPTWRGDKGKRLIGALNYLASAGGNAFSFLTYNYGGDGSDVWPLADPTDRTRYDCSKLDQWEVVFSHADTLGLFLHFKTQETEVDTERFAFDGNGTVGREHRLYFRELAARFGHHLALNWNLGEENTQTAVERAQMVAAMAGYDPYHHHIVVHSYPDQQDIVYTPLLTVGNFTGASVQTHASDVHRDVLRWVQASETAGNPWVVANDEQGSADNGVYPDDAYPSDAIEFKMVGEVLYGTFMAGGMGVEAYFGYAHAHSDMTCEDWRSRDQWWRYGNLALQFFRAFPFWTMRSEDGLVRTGDYCFAARGDIYMVYHHSAIEGSTVLDLSHTDHSFKVTWYDTLTGAQHEPVGTGEIVTGGASVGYGSPPTRNGLYWVAVLTKETTSPSQCVGSLPGPCLHDCVPGGLLWADSYSVDGRCYCLFGDAAFDHDIGTVNVSTPSGTRTVQQVCEDIRSRFGEGPTTDRVYYNTVQCGHGPANNAGDEDRDACPGRVDIGTDGCRDVGPCWDLAAAYAPTPATTVTPTATPSTATPTANPTMLPSAAPSVTVTGAPSVAPSSASPSIAPTPSVPTASPTKQEQTAAPTPAPSPSIPTPSPTKQELTAQPSSAPTVTITGSPSRAQTPAPTTTPLPSEAPTGGSFPPAVADEDRAAVLTPAGTAGVLIAVVIMLAILVAILVLRRRQAEASAALRGSVGSTVSSPDRVFQQGGRKNRQIQVVEDCTPSVESEV